MITHRDCPLNKRNLVVTTDDQPAAQPAGWKGKTKRKAKQPVDTDAQQPVAKRNKTNKAQRKTEQPVVGTDAQQPKTKKRKNRKRKAAEIEAAHVDVSDDSDDSLGDSDYFHALGEPHAQPTTPAVARSVEKPSPPLIPRFNPKVNDSVLAQWKRNQLFLAHVTHINDGSYTVYFVEDSKVKKGLRLTQLRPLQENLTSVIPRCQPVRENTEWYFHGAKDLEKGRWKVRSLGPKNTYVCVRITGDGKNIENFDIGYVMSEIREQTETARENGP